MVFHHHPSNAGAGHDGAGDQYPTGGRFAAPAPSPAWALDQLRRAVAAGALRDGERSAAEVDLDAVAASSVDPEGGARALDRLARQLLAAGSLTSAASGPVMPLKALAGWIGPPAGSVGQLLRTL